MRSQGFPEHSLNFHNHTVCFEQHIMMQARTGRAFVCFVRYDAPDTVR